MALGVAMFLIFLFMVPALVFADFSNIVFSSNRDGNFEIYIMSSADGSGQTNLTNNPAVDGFPFGEFLGTGPSTGIIPVVEPEPKVGARTHSMTCWRVWINEDNNFQFIFWYPYKDNNWVRIYDMEDNLVFETDLPINNPNLTVDLPEGFYMVKTFHHDTMLQEFLIGKP